MFRAIMFHLLLWVAEINADRAEDAIERGDIDEAYRLIAKGKEAAERARKYT